MMKEKDFVREASRAGGAVYIVGGSVRDSLRGSSPKDRDYVVCGLSEDVFCRLFPDAFKTGRAFPVYRLSIDGESREVAFARSETKTGRGYGGFTPRFSPETTIEEDLRRRDTTMNSIARALPSGTLIDPFGGARDIEKRVIRATSEHFSDDPVRALRAARQAAQFDFSIEPGTLARMRACREEIRLEPGERLANELDAALATERPSVFFRILLDAGLLDATYPEIYALVGKSQPPEHHPEGDAFRHSMQVLDRAARLSTRNEVRFAALVHDIGKGRTPDDLLPRHIGHEKRGIEALDAFCRRIPLPNRWTACASFAIREHMRAQTLEQPAKITDLIVRLLRHPIGFDGFSAVLQADHESLPAYLEHVDRLREAIDAIDGRDAPKELAGAEIGAWVRARRIDAVRRILNRRTDHG